jgi:hypothetical protein
VTVTVTVTVATFGAGPSACGKACMMEKVRIQNIHKLNNKVNGSVIDGEMVGRGGLGSCKSS